MESLRNLIVAIAQVGATHPLYPPVHRVSAFEHFFVNGALDRNRLDERDGGCTRRELLLRMLLLNAVLDQGPDIEGVREMLIDVVNALYESEIRIFHSPLEFFREINVSVDEIWQKHAEVRERRAERWAVDNEASATRYNLYLDNSKQTLGYAVFRWGVPLALPYLLECDFDVTPTALIDYLEESQSAEQMSVRLKSDEKYGLGKAIGNKACHLFAKWMVSTFQLSRRSSESGWGAYSFEVPFDSNAGRVLWRCGYFLQIASDSDYVDKGVVQMGQGQDGAHYIRVTNMRGMRLSIEVPVTLRNLYVEICMNHLYSNTRAPRTIELQRFQHVLLREQNDENLTVAAFDDGLIEIGRNYCFNHANPRCGECPINNHCEGYLSRRELITDYRT